MVPLQTALPLRALAMCGYATDPRAERAYAWLLAQRLEDGAWPTGKRAAARTGVSPAIASCPTRGGDAVRTPPARCSVWRTILSAPGAGGAAGAGSAAGA
jgi:hypothetical protein